MENKKFYIDFDTIRMCYPYDISRKVSKFGVLEQYKNKTYTMKEINEIIAHLVVKNPFINNSMYVSINIMNGGAYHHMLNFKNYQYSNQEKMNDKELGFLY